MLGRDLLADAGFKIQHAATATLDEPCRVAVVEAPFLKRFGDQRKSTHRGAIGKITAWQHDASGADDAMPTETDRFNGPTSQLFRYARASHPATAIVVGGGVNPRALRAAGKLVKGQVSRHTEVRVAPDMVRALKAKPPIRREYLGTAVYSGSLADLDIAGADNHAIPGDAHIVADMRKAEAAQLLGAIVPRIKRVLHPRKLPHRGLAEKRKARVW
jgi:hypothetical protein